MNNMRKLLDTPKLILPRLRLIIEHPELIQQELEKEVEEAEEKTRRLLRGHDVVGHVRVLPPGYSPSPEARQKAAKLNIQLAENETWVKKYHRGDETRGEIKSHEAVQRSR
jgi:hypothetical protein